MRCGNCKADHETVAEVRHCFGTKPGQPTDKQLSLAQALGRERVRLAAYKDLSEEDYHLRIAGLSRRQISGFITDMMKQPYADALLAHALFGRLLNGKYALRNLDDDDVRFYAITGESPRRLYELTGGAGDFKFQRIYRSEKILRRIAEDPIAAFALFGIKVGKCGRCGSPLTQKHTRERGIGDTCYAKMMGEQ